MKKNILIVITLIVGFMLISSTVSADQPVEKPSICHPVNGKGELGNGWNLISPAKASSHINEALYPDGEYWKHESKDGRHDIYSTDGKTCPTPDTPPVVVVCPVGSDEIGIDENGDPICKAHPTGCPYGDSIPLGPECDKHNPVVELTPLTPVEEPVYEYYSGK